MRRPWLVRKWRLWRMDRRLQQLDQGPLGLRFVGRCPIAGPPAPLAAPADPPLLTRGQECLYQVPAVRL